MDTALRVWRRRTADTTLNMNNRAASSTLRLLQLASPMLPVGAYAYSQGLEWAVERGWVCDEDSAAHWIEGVMAHSLGRLDVPLLARLHRAWRQDDEQAVHRLSRYLDAARESAELKAEQRQLGQSLARLLAALDMDAARPWTDIAYSSFATLFALAAVRWEVDESATLNAYLWAWGENQVAAAMKLVPLGQTAGQRILSRLITRIPDLVAHAAELADDQLGFFAPRLALASAQHETQYTRLFRS